MEARYNKLKAEVRSSIEPILHEVIASFAPGASMTTTSGSTRIAPSTFGVHHGIEIGSRRCLQTAGVRAVDTGVVDNHVGGFAVQWPGQARDAGLVRQVESDHVGVQRLQACQPSVVTSGGAHAGAVGALLANEFEAEAARCTNDEYFHVNLREVGNSSAQRCALCASALVS